MFLDGNLFWLLMGVILVVVGAAFKAFADDQGWKLTWWKAVLALLWYGLFASSFYIYGTVTGEGEGSAALKMLLFILFICLILGVGLWRLMLLGAKPKTITES
jgi:hypothetical protein